MLKSDCISLIKHTFPIDMVIFAYQTETFLVEVLCHGPTDDKCFDVGVNFW